MKKLIFVCMLLAMGCGDVEEVADKTDPIPKEPLEDFMLVSGVKMKCDPDLEELRPECPNEQILTQLLGMCDSKTKSIYGIEASEVLSTWTIVFKVSYFDYMGEYTNYHIDFDNLVLYTQRHDEQYFDWKIMQIMEGTFRQEFDQKKLEEYTRDHKSCKPN